MKRTKQIPPCPRCHRHTPRLGETICEACKEETREHDQRQEAIRLFHLHIDCVEDDSTQKCLRQLYFLITGDET